VVSYRWLVPLILSVSALALLFFWGSDVAEKDESGPESSVSIEGLYPDFDLAQSRYVSRCGRGAAPIRAEAGRGATIAVGSARPRTGAMRIGGALPGEDFTIAVVSGGDRDEYTVRCLPADFPNWRFEELRATKPGLFVVSFRPSRDARSWIIVFDHEGVPRWWFNPDTRPLWAQVHSDGTISWARSFGDGYGLDPRMAHEVRSPSGKLLRVVRTKGSIIDGHEFRKLRNGNLLVDTYVPGTQVNLKPFGGPAKASAVFAEIQEIDPHGRVVWRWNSRGHIALEETGRWWRNVLSNPKRNRRDLKLFDPVHINSIDPNRPDEIVISARHTDAIYGIKRSSGEILWKLGGTETANSLRIVGDPAAKLFGGQHDARISDDGTLSVYDNSKARPRRPRVVAYRLDLERGTATYLDQLNDPKIETSHCCGSARPLEGGGWLVGWGDNPLVTGFDIRGRIAFRVWLAASSFRAVPVPEGATTPAALDRGLEMMEPDHRKAGGRAEE
jgi:Arylsulfotransferase (ASST)